MVPLMKNVQGFDSDNSVLPAAQMLRMVPGGQDDKS
jgi:hypothetical protein